MTIGLIGLGVLCLLYYIFTSLVGMDFAVVWLAGAVICIGSGAVGKYMNSHGIVMSVYIKAVLGIVVGLGLLVFVVGEGFIISGMTDGGTPGLDYVVVLGAQVRGTVPSRALYSRIKKAAEYLEENPETKAVLSGGQGAGEEISEAQVMYDYLTGMGIAKERLIMEDKSTSTMENLEFTAELIGKDKKVGIVSQNFHIYRAVQLAKHQQYDNVCGIAASAEIKYLPHYMVREFFALIKEKLTGNI